MTGMHNRHSLLTQMLVRIFAISLAAIVVMYMAIHSQIDRSLEILRDQTVEEQANDLGSYLVAGKSVNKVVFNLPEHIRVFYAKAGPSYQYLVRDEAGTILFRSPFAYATYFPTDYKSAPDGKFSFKGPSDYDFVGVTRQHEIAGMTYYLQVAQTQKAADLFSDKISDAFMARVLWIGVPFYLALLAIILLTVKRAFSPLYRAAREADNVSITSPDFQIQETELPSEIRPFVKAINFSYRRLGKSIQEQKELTENLAHELRTPLAVLKANIENMGRSRQSEKLTRDVDIMIKLVNQMLDMTRLEYADTIRMQNLDVSAVVSQVCQDLWPLFLKEHRELRVSGVEHPLMIKGDRDLIYRAIRNVLDNALEHSPAKTPVDVSIEGCVVKVRDYGNSIPDELRSKIFDRLHRISERAAIKSGAGLGLSIVSKTMEVHSGRATLETARDGGNIFILDFKALDCSPDSSAA